MKNTRKLFNTLIGMLLLAVPFSCTQPSGNNEETTGTADASASYNTLTEEEKTDGWKLLFDGSTTNGWHSYLKDGVQGWTVENGILSTKGGNGDIVTDKTYGNFELKFEFAVAPEGNSGVFYFIQEDPKYEHTFYTAPEYQIIDDENYPADLKEAQYSGSNYDIHPPKQKTAKPAGEFNEARIVVNNKKVEHYLNGVKVVEYELGSEDWTTRVENSKFNQWDYAEQFYGKIGLQDHGDKVSFRNIKIKELPGVAMNPLPDAKVIFDGSREMLDEKWTYWEGPRLAASLPIKWEIVEDPVDNGTAMDSNDPAAAGGVYGAADIVTKKKYEDFRLHVEFFIQDEGGNSGVYLQNRYEIQILDGDSTKHGLGAVINETESPYHAYNGVGKWNAYDILFRAAQFENGEMTEKPLVTVYFNGQKVHENVTINQVWGGENSGLDGGNDGGKGITDRPGGIKLQAEGHHVLYRNIWIKEMEIVEAETSF